MSEPDPSLFVYFGNFWEKEIGNFPEHHMVCVYLWYIYNEHTTSKSMPERNPTEETIHSGFRYREHRMVRKKIYSQLDNGYFS
jgi:hypothetical protein